MKKKWIKTKKNYKKTKTSKKKKKKFNNFVVSKL